MPVRRGSAEGRRDDMPGGFYSVPGDAQGTAAARDLRRVALTIAHRIAAIVVASIDSPARAAHLLFATHCGGQLQYGDSRVRP
jgi:hypothetical protein